MSPRLKGALLLVVAFGLGAAAGAMGLGIYQVRSGVWGSAPGSAPSGSAAGSGSGPS